MELVKMDLRRKHSAAYARVVLEENFARMVRMGLRSVTVLFWKSAKAKKFLTGVVRWSLVGWHGLLRGKVINNEPIGSLSKPRRRRQRERHQTKGLMSRTMAMHVRYKSLYISLPSSAKQQREMTKFCVLYGTWTTTANISYFHLELHAAIAHLARARF